MDKKPSNLANLVTYEENTGLPEFMPDGMKIPRIGDIIDNKKVRTVGVDLEGGRMIARDQQGRIIKGSIIKGNVGPQGATEAKDIFESVLSREDKERLVDEMRWIAFNSKNEETRLKALDKLMDRLWGKATQNIDIVSDNNVSIEGMVGAMFGLQIEQKNDQPI